MHSVAWQPPMQVRGPAGDGSVEQPLCVLSSSMDRTMMLWRPDPSVGTLLFRHIVIVCTAGVPRLSMALMARISAQLNLPTPKPVSAVLSY